MLTELSRPEPLRHTVEKALADLRGRSARYLGLLRLLGALGFLVLAAFLGFGRGLNDWRLGVPVHAAYAAVAGLIVLALRRQRVRTAVALVAPLIDVAMVYWLQRGSLWVSPFPAGVAGWSLGPFVLLVLFASLTLRPGLIYGTALAAALAEGALQAQVGVGGGAIAASVGILLLTAAVTHWAAGRLEAMVRDLVSEQVRVRLVTERSEELRRANEATAAARAQLAEQHEKLLAAQREAETLTGLLVHDMKGPLAGVLMMVELVSSRLQRGPEHVELAKDLKLAEVQGRRLLEMIHDLLAVARLEKGTLQPKRRGTVLAALCESTVAAYAASAKGRGVQLAARLEGAPAVQLDPELIQRVLDNLISNALAHVSAGDRVEVFAALEGQELQLGVRNSGPAVAQAARGRLFERAGGTGNGRSNAGLGLYFCRLVAEAHGGRIALEEHAGWSVTFVLRLPAEAAAAAA
jgi:signal transduction histidine kinase